MGATETAKERSDRQLIELLTELRVALPGAQVLLGFLLTVPFATRFGRVTRPERALFFACLLLAATGTVLLMAPSVYHRIRWERGGKEDVVRVAHRFFLAGTGLLGAAIIAAVLLVADVLFGLEAGALSAGAVCLTLVGAWYVVPLRRAAQADPDEDEADTEVAGRSPLARAEHLPSEGGRPPSRSAPR